MKMKRGWHIAFVYTLKIKDTNVNVSTSNTRRHSIRY
ncbi:hypothetical protein SERP1404 [Staphylococcus epidermidis RP62A]|uniref:Uncharacterized protein n=1 Tax=Staphylococcus epidermidis (strain ATCC 35984 / DSM 28319 / BCRC 17069 / CCUG 31568 / BM 3577 / RP62A) TaxID=176279 RepID=Q5HN68_STAEQ|nr:hypothetical protein SERP1404 [Staphylococcus epidermidis RP62A]